MRQVITNRQLHRLERQAKKLSQAEKCPEKKALNTIAMRNGFQDWGSVKATNDLYNKEQLCFDTGVIVMLKSRTVTINNSNWTQCHYMEVLASSHIENWLKAQQGLVTTKEKKLIASQLVFFRSMRQHIDQNINDLYEQIKIDFPNSEVMLLIANGFVIDNNLLRTPMCA